MQPEKEVSRTARYSADTTLAERAVSRAVEKNFIVAVWKFLSDKCEFVE